VEYIEGRDMDYRVHLDVFEGPLDLLLHLLDQEKLDIWDIEISRITEQYLVYLATMQEHDLEVAGDFLVMAATLLQIKARALLPEDEEAVDEADDGLYSRDELIRRLITYRQYREVAERLKHMAEERLSVLPRPFSSLGETGPIKYTNPIGNATVQDLTSALVNALTNWTVRKQVQTIKGREINLQERIGEIALVAQRHSPMFFGDLLDRKSTRTDVVFTFLAVLELVRQGIIVVRQEKIFGPIIVKSQLPKEESNHGA